MQFGSGSRTCIGKNFSLLEISLLVPELVRSFDFALVDGLLEGARRHGLRLIVLWFGSWKNGMSSYVPAWVKHDQGRFPRVAIGGGTTIEVLTPLASANQEADARAFAALIWEMWTRRPESFVAPGMSCTNEKGVSGARRRGCAGKES